MAAIFIRPTPVVDTQTRQQPERGCVIPAAWRRACIRSWPMGGWENETVVKNRNYKSGKESSSPGFDCFSTMDG